MTFALDIPSLNGLRSFLVAAKYQSFTLAAKELGVTPGAVNRLVHNLEDELNVQLFDRAGRSIKLTAVGASYQEMILPAFQIIAATTKRLVAQTIPNTLRVNAPATLALHWLLPRLPSFQERTPWLVLDITAKDNLSDFEYDIIDIVISYTRGKKHGIEQIFLMPVEFGIFCSPQFLDSHEITSPHDLLKCPRIATSAHPEAWPQYFTEHFVPVEIKDQVPAHAFEHYVMSMAAAVGSMGIALLPLYIVDKLVESGQLIQALQETLHPQEAYYIEHRGQNTSIQAFKSWLLSQISTTEKRA